MKGKREESGKEMGGPFPTGESKKGAEKKKNPELIKKITRR